MIVMEQFDICRHGNGEMWRQILHSPSSYPTPIYIHVTLSISNEDEKMNIILVPDRFGYLRPIPAMHNFFLMREEVFFSP